MRIFLEQAIIDSLKTNFCYRKTAQLLYLIALDGVIQRHLWKESWKKKNRLFVSQKNDSGVKQSFASRISCRFIHFDPIDWLHTDLKYSLVEIRTMSGFFFYWFRLLQIVFHITAPVEIERRINQPSTMSLCFVFFSFIYFELGQPAQRQTCGFANDEPAIKIIDSQKESFVFTNSLIKSLNYLQWIILFILSTQKTFLFS